MLEENFYAPLSKKLLDPQNSPNCYWLMLKTLLKIKKKSLASHLYYTKINLLLISKEEPKMLKTFFTDHCSMLRNKSDLPTILSQKTLESLTTIDFPNNDFLKIIRNLDPNKPYGHDIISIRMVKMCDDSTCKPLKLIFQS